jgi:phage recombination protein Bet
MESLTPTQAQVTKETVEQFLFSTNTKLTPQQKALFLNLAVGLGLNPFKREIHCIPFGNTFNFVTGYQVYIQRANATGLLNGWEVQALYETGKDKLVGARCTIWRKDWEKPFVWYVRFDEFYKNQSNWKTMPEFMIKKVCIAQAFRLAFPEELGGLPCTADEIGNGDEQIIPVTEAPIQEQDDLATKFAKEIQEIQGPEEIPKVAQAIKNFANSLTEEEKAHLRKLLIQKREELQQQLLNGGKNGKDTQPG